MCPAVFHALDEKPALVGVIDLDVTNLDGQVVARCCASPIVLLQLVAFDTLWSVGDVKSSVASGAT